MPPIVRQRLLIFVSSILLVSFGSVAVILFARGYRPNLQTKSFLPTGLLVAKSFPDAAQIYVNGQLESATDTTMNLTPREYDIAIKKEGYIPWQKHITVEAEIVSRATARLFPSVPTLRPITTTGAKNPSASPDGEKAVYSTTDKTGSKLFLIDLNESPLGLLNRDSRQIATSQSVDFTKLSYTWSPDSRQIVGAATSSAYLIDLASNQIQNISLNPTELTVAWQARIDTRSKQILATLPKTLQEILATSAANLVWSPSETKVLYTATASAVLPEELKRPLLGSNNQPQVRELKPNQVYIYDLEEDRNFFVATTVLPTPTPKAAKNKKTNNQHLPAGRQDPQPNAGWRWFPTSSHIYKVETNKVIVKEYDSQNETIVYAGPLENSFAAPYSSGRQLLILANVAAPTPGTTITPPPQLHAVSLK